MPRALSSKSRRGIGDRGGDRHLAGAVEDHLGIDARHGRAHRRGVGDVHALHLHAVGFLQPGRVGLGAHPGEVVEGRHGMAQRDETRHGIAADEAGSTGHENAHDPPPQARGEPEEACYTLPRATTQSPRVGAAVIAVALGHTTISADPEARVRTAVGRVRPRDNEMPPSPPMPE